MRVLLDECLPTKLRDAVTALGHECDTVLRVGFASKKNGELLSLAEGRWDVLLTSDQNIRHQQHLAGRQIAIVVLCAKTNRLKDLLPLVPECGEILKSVQPGQLVEVGR